MLRYATKQEVLNIWAAALSAATVPSFTADSAGLLPGGSSGGSKLSRALSQACEQAASENRLYGWVEVMGGGEGRRAKREMEKYRGKLEDGKWRTARGRSSERIRVCGGRGLCSPQVRGSFLSPLHTAAGKERKGTTPSTCFRRWDFRHEGEMNRRELTGGSIKGIECF